MFLNYYKNNIQFLFQPFTLFITILSFIGFFAFLGREKYFFKFSFNGLNKK